MLLAFCFMAATLAAGAGPAKPKGTFRVTPRLAAAAFSRDRKWLAVGGGELDKSGTVSLFEARTGRERFALAGHTDLVLALAFSPDGKTLASAGWDRSIRLWDAQTGNKQAALVGHTRQVWSLAFSPDGKLLASGSADRTARLWDVAAGREKARRSGLAASAVGFSPAGRTLAVGGDDGTVQLWDVAKARERATLRGHTNRVNAVAFAPDGMTLATASWDTTVRLWEVAREQVKATLAGHRGSLVSLAYSPDGQMLASACRYHQVRREGGPRGEITDIEDGNEVKVWAVGRGKARLTFEPDGASGLVAVGLSPDGKVLTTVNSDGTVRHWDLPRLAGPEAPEVPRGERRPARQAPDHGREGAARLPDGNLAVFPGSTRRGFVMQAFVYLASIAVLPAFADARETERPRKEPTSVKVEVRAKLRVTGKLRKVPALDTPARPGSPASYELDEASLVTGATLETEQLGVIEVYFGGDARLQESAVKLNGKTVLLTGELDRVTYFSRTHLVPVEVTITKASEKTRILMPSWVTRTFIRANRIEAAPAP
jgi:hypothetical protein